MSDTTAPASTPDRPVRYLHGARPNGSHAWLPFRTRAELRKHRDVFVPHCPADTVWTVSAHTQVPAIPDDPEETP